MTNLYTEDGVGAGARFRGDTGFPFWVIKAIQPITHAKQWSRRKGPKPEGSPYVLGTIVVAYRYRIFFLLLFNLLLHPESVGTEDSEQDSNTMGHIKDFAVEKASESMSGRRS